MTLKFAFAATAALMAVSGVTPALADIAAGNYWVKSDVSTIATKPTGNATLCAELQQKKGSISYSFDGYTASTATAAGSFRGVSDVGGTFYVEVASVPEGSALIGSTVTANVFPESFYLGVLTAGSSPTAIGTISIKFTSATATAAGYSVKTTRTLTVTGVGSCVYTSTDTFTTLP